MFLRLLNKSMWIKLQTYIKYYSKMFILFETPEQNHPQVKVKDPSLRRTANEHYFSLVTVQTQKILTESSKFSSQKHV